MLQAVMNRSSMKIAEKDLQQKEREWQNKVEEESKEEDPLSDSKNGTK